MFARSRLSILTLVPCLIVAACSSAGSESGGAASGAGAKDGTATNDPGAGEDRASPGQGGTTAPGGELAAEATYEAPDGEECADVGAYDWTVDLVLPDGNPDHCLFGTINRNLFERGKPPLPEKALEKKECLEAEKNPGPCEFKGTRCNWEKTSVAPQDGDNGTKIGKVTMTTGAKAFSRTRVMFYGSEHHVLNDGTDMFPKCSWVVRGTKK